MKNLFKYRYIIFTLSLSFFLVSCAKTEDEKLFKSAAIELNRLLKEYEAIPAPQKHFVDERGRNIVVIDYKSRDEFVEQTRDKWLSLAHDFEKYYKTYPQNKWADDSLFCLVLFARLEPTKEKGEFKNVAIAALKNLVYESSSFKLETWTKKTFKNSVIKKYQIFYKEELPGVSFDEQLKASLRLALAIQLQKEGKLEEAEKIFENLLSNYSGTRFGKFVRSCQNEVAGFPPSRE